MKLSLIALSFLVASLAPLPVSAQTLFDDLGGKQTIHTFVARSLALSMQDPRVRPTLEKSDLNRLSDKITDQVCELTGGPCVYDGLNMQKAHVGLGLTTAHFNLLVEHLQQAMDESGVPFSTQNRLLALLAPMYDDVVEDN